MRYAHEEYQADLASLAGQPERGTSENQSDGGGTTDPDVVGLHFDNLFDQDETESGDTIDPVTGKKIDNSTDTGDESLTHLIPSSRNGDVLPSLRRTKADREADDWLAAKEAELAKESRANEAARFATKQAVTSRATNTSRTTDQNVA